MSSSTSCMKLATSGGSLWISLSLRPSFRRFSSRKNGCRGWHTGCHTLAHKTQSSGNKKNKVKEAEGKKSTICSGCTVCISGHFLFVPLSLQSSQQQYREKPQALSPNKPIWSFSLLKTAKICLSVRLYMLLLRLCESSSVLKIHHEMNTMHAKFS